MDHFHNLDLKDTVITIRLEGTLQKGRVSDINFKEIFTQLYAQGAYYIMKQTAKLNSEEFEEIKISPSSPELAEEEIIKEHLQQIKMFDPETEMHLTKSLLQALNTGKKEGENVTDFQERVISETEKILNIKEK